MRFRVMILAGVLAALPATDGAGRNASIQDFEWLHDLEAARKKARKEGKPLLVVFR